MVEVRKSRLYLNLRAWITDGRGGLNLRHAGVVALTVIAMIFTGRGCGGSSDKNAEETSWTKYRSSEELAGINFSIRPSREGVFGLKWGERPRSSRFKTPCQVEYRLTHTCLYYQALRLSYSDNGLIAVTLYAPISFSMPDYEKEGVSKENIRMLERNFVESGVVPVFGLHVEAAEEVLGQSIVWTDHGDRLMGISKGEGDGYFGTVRLDYKKDGGEQHFGIWRSSK